VRFVAVACALVSSALVSLALFPAWGEAQDFTFNPTRQWQARADVGHSDRGSNGGTGCLLTTGRWRSAVEGSIGDGLRLSVVLRRARVNGR